MAVGLMPDNTVTYPVQIGATIDDDYNHHLCQRPIDFISSLS